MAPKRPTLRAVAKAAGCSVTAASKVLNNAKGTANIGEKARTRILAVAEKLGYNVSYHAQALQTGRANTVGLVLGMGKVNDYWAPFFRGVDQATHARGSDLLIIGPTREEREFTRGITMLQQGRIDALIVPSNIYHPHIESLSDPKLRIVAMGHVASERIPSVITDLRPGIRQAVDHLAELGHRKILWVPHPPYRQRYPQPELDRDHVLHETAELHGIEIDELPIDDINLAGDLQSTIDHCRLFFADYLRHHQPPSAIIAYNERVALGIYSALMENGYRIPSDVSVIGYDDLHAQSATPSMTTISLNLHEHGHRAAELALDLVDRGETGSGDQRIWVSSELIVRRSTGPASSG